MLKITTWNVNSIRKRGKIIKDFIFDFFPDILLFQETKVNEEKFPIEFFYDLGYPFVFHSGENSGYNGVAIISKKPLKKLPSFMLTREARHLAVLAPEECIEIHNLYVPAGGYIPSIENSIKFRYKIDFLTMFSFWLKRKFSYNKLILAGDFNIAPLEHDVWSHQKLIKQVGHTPIEVATLRLLYNSLNFKDAVRKFIPDSEKLYSWWSYRLRDWKKQNKGRRLDHIWLTDPLYNSVVKSKISRYTRDLDTPSDHVPVSIILC